MAQRVDTAIVMLWGSEIGAVSWDDTRELGIFQYTPEFATSGIEVAPLTMPLSEQAYSFPALPRETFKRLPGLLADVLPDKFGNALIDSWLARKGISKAEFSPVDRLCYIGQRGMGALEFKPSVDRNAANHDHPLNIDALVTAASNILQRREALHGELQENEPDVNEKTLADILHVGSSAGGARAKAVIAWNPENNEVRSGQILLPPGFEHWLLKFDGVSNNRDKELADGQGYGKMEYAYYRMALAAGIEMTECRLLKENKRAHFMTRRFDRTRQGQKLHMQSLCAMEHFDFNMPGAYSYEQAMITAQKLNLGATAVEQIFKRALFNIMARNQDDHVKNIAFLMDTTGQWKLAPAFDLTFSYNPEGEFTQLHQMSFNGKRDAFELSDFYAVAAQFGITTRKARSAIEQVEQGVKLWPKYAQEADVEEQRIAFRQRQHRLNF
ncbi:serine/threonine-protein kinase HipA [Alteromonadaceae bacterium 2753L.S.0a.02]|nr:serine/threonine-protein kinase HipA [Alteromonadaceae bacterium 2753L.S.0a.02]